MLALLAKESSLMRDRQLLAREVEFLRSQLTSATISGQDQMWASRTLAIEDIMSSVKRQQEDSDWERLRDTQQDTWLKEQQVIKSSERKVEEKEVDETEVEPSKPASGVTWMDSGQVNMWDEAEPE